MAKRQSRKGIQLIVGIINIFHTVNHPRIAIGIRIEQGHGLIVAQRQNEILGIEHIEHREQRVAFDHCHIAHSRRHSRKEFVHFRLYVGVNQFLITTQVWLHDNRRWIYDNTMYCSR